MSGRPVWDANPLTRKSALSGRHGPTQNSSCFFEANYFFISEMNDLKPCMVVNQALNCTFLKVLKSVKKNFFKYFYTFSQKHFGSNFPKTALIHVS